MVMHIITDIGFIFPIYLKYAFLALASMCASTISTALSILFVCRFLKLYRTSEFLKRSYVSGVPPLDENDITHMNSLLSIESSLPSLPVLPATKTTNDRKFLSALTKFTALAVITNCSNVLLFVTIAITYCINPKTNDSSAALIMTFYLMTIISNFYCDMLANSFADHLYRVLCGYVDKHCRSHCENWNEKFIESNVTIH